MAHRRCRASLPGGGPPSAPSLSLPPISWQNSGGKLPDWVSNIWQFGVKRSPGKLAHQQTDLWCSVPALEQVPSRARELQGRSLVLRGYVLAEATKNQQTSQETRGRLLFRVRCWAPQEGAFELRHGQEVGDGRHPGSWRGLGRCREASQELVPTYS